MKRKNLYIFILIIMSLVVLSGCKGKNNEVIQGDSYKFERLTVEEENGQVIKRTYKIIPLEGASALEEDLIAFMDDNKIEYKEEIYFYEFNGKGNAYNLNIVFPNKETYYWQEQGSGGSGNGIIWQYPNGELILDAVKGINSVALNDKNDNSHPFVGFIFLIGGLFSLIWAKAAWYISYGWRYKNAEPSETAITFERIGGVIAIIIAFIIFLN